MPTSGTTAAVTRIIDGDTIEVNIAGALKKVRYAGIDAPEIDSGDWLATDATSFNAQLVSGKTVRLEKDISETDVYDRLLRYVYVGDIFVNAELVKAGLARATPFPPDVKNEALFKNMETDAARAGKGLWTKPQMTFIFYDGLVPQVESDEYVEITNYGSPVDLKGWVLQDVATASQRFTFPAYVLGTGKTIRVYTNEKHPEWGGFSFGLASAIWRNSLPPDKASLSDSQNQIVSRRSYQIVQ